MKNEEGTSPPIPSSQDSAPEDFNWVKDKNYPAKIKEDYLKYPLEKWREMVFEPKVNDSNSFILHPGDIYEDRVNKVLKFDVFKDFEFYEDKNGLFNFNLSKYYKVDKDKLTKEFIIPDFFVHRIEAKKIKELLDKRSYMMKYSNKINKEYISIIGEIKSSHHQAHKNSPQKIDYITFIKNADSKDEELLIMYVYDESYQLFQKDIAKKNKPNFILCYIPKLYADECYSAFNDTIVELKSNLKKIDLKKATKKRFSKKEIIKHYEQKYNCLLFIIAICILIISFLLAKIIYKF